MDWLTGIFIPLFASVLGALLGGVGTYFGVKWTVGAEADQERQNKIILKNKLILGILHEIYLLNDFYRLTPNINQRQGSFLTIESRFIDETVSDQVHLFDNPDIIKTLSNIRLYIQLVKGTLTTFRDLEWSKVNQPYKVAIGEFGTHKHLLYDMENSELKRIASMLKAEYVGPLPKDLSV
jgi:hypothetical protein